MLSAKSTAAGWFTTTRSQIADTPITTEATTTGMQSSALPARDATPIIVCSCAGPHKGNCLLLIMQLNAYSRDFTGAFLSIFSN